MTDAVVSVFVPQAMRFAFRVATRYLPQVADRRS